MTHVRHTLARIRQASDEELCAVLDMTVVYPNDEMTTAICEEMQDRLCDQV
jgi:hypothetical protein